MCASAQRWYSQQIVDGENPRPASTDLRIIVNISYIHQPHPPLPPLLLTCAISPLPSSSVVRLLWIPNPPFSVQGITPRRLPAARLQLGRSAAAAATAAAESAATTEAERRRSSSSGEGAVAASVGDQSSRPSTNTPWRHAAAAAAAAAADSQDLNHGEAEPKEVGEAVQDDQDGQLQLQQQQQQQQCHHFYR